jgi:protein-tyrosine-phosphatase
MVKAMTRTAFIFAVICFAVCVQAIEGKKDKVVFVCEHGSAKSVVAAAHFNRIAAEQNLNFFAISRGTNPDAEVPSNVSAGLKKDGIDLPVEKPKLLSLQDAKKAVRIVTFCELPKEYSRINVENWDDVPPISEDYERSRNEIVKRIEELTKQLSRR